MKKFSIAIVVLAAAVVSAGPLAHHKSPLNTSKRTVPSTIQSVFPLPSCPPSCAVPTPSQTPN